VAGLRGKQDLGQRKRRDCGENPHVVFAVGPAREHQHRNSEQQQDHRYGDDQRREHAVIDQVGCRRLAILGTLCQPLRQPALLSQRADQHHNVDHHQGRDEAPHLLDPVEPVADKQEGHVAEQTKYEAQRVVAAALGERGHVVAALGRYRPGGLFDRAQAAGPIRP
jgi:hypothetical protein